MIKIYNKIKRKKLKVSMETFPGFAGYVSNNPYLAGYIWCKLKKNIQCWFQKIYLMLILKNLFNVSFKKYF